MRDVKTDRPRRKSPRGLELSAASRIMIKIRPSKEGVCVMLDEKCDWPTAAKVLGATRTF